MDVWYNNKSIQFMFNSFSLFSDQFLYDEITTFFYINTKTFVMGKE